MHTPIIKPQDPTNLSFMCMLHVGTLSMQYKLASNFAGAGAELAGVLLTHLHMGHYIGLFQFGREALNKQGLKVGYQCGSSSAMKTTYIHVAMRQLADKM